MEMDADALEIKNWLGCEKIEGDCSGTGANSKVYKAVYENGEAAAVKVISLPDDSSESNRKDVLKRIKLMQSLGDCENIVKVEKYKQKGNKFYICMELLIPLDQYIKDVSLTEEDISDLFRDIGTAIEICQEKKIIHCDIKPENIFIFIKDSKKFKLGDFGSACDLGKPIVEGTYNYMAPEVKRGEIPDSRADIYSLGIVLYYLSNDKKLPFWNAQKMYLSPKDEEKALYRRLCGEELPKPRDASPEMAKLILRACAFKPEDRFSSATEMKEALEKVVDNYDKTINLRGVSEEDKQNPDPPFDDTPKKSKLPKIMAISLALIILTNVGLFLANKYLNMQEEIVSIIEKADALADAENLEGAVAKIEDGLKKYPNTDKLQDKLDEYNEILTEKEVAAITADADSFASSGSLDEAVEIVENGLTVYPENAVLQGKLEEYNASLAEIASIIESADTLADAENFESAAAKIEDGLKRYPSIKKLRDKLNEYNKILAEQQKAVIVVNSAPPTSDGSLEGTAENVENVNVPDVSHESSYPEQGSHTEQSSYPEEAYIIADSNSRYLTEDDIAGMSLQSLKYARNEIYARHGRIFQSEELNEYFSQQTWYQGIIRPEDFDENILNDYERKNAILIRDMENKISSNVENVTVSNTSNSDEVYIIRDSNIRYLTEDEISNMSLQLLNYARNEIYARHGRIFKSNELNLYFSKQSWYQGVIRPEDFEESTLNDYERKNASLLLEMEHKIDPNGYSLDSGN